MASRCNCSLKGGLEFRDTPEAHLVYSVVDTSKCLRRESVYAVWELPGAVVVTVNAVDASPPAYKRDARRVCVWKKSAHAHTKFFYT